MSQISKLGQAIIDVPESGESIPVPGDSLKIAKYPVVPVAADRAGNVVITTSALTVNTGGAQLSSAKAVDQVLSGANDWVDDLRGIPWLLKQWQLGLLQNCYSAASVWAYPQALAGHRFFAM